MKQEMTRLWKSFMFAFEGIIHAFKKEKNIRIHAVIGMIACIFGWIFEITKWEWCIITILFGGMLSLELINSAIERSIDLITKEKQPLAKQAKDLAAGAVFVFAIVSVIIGVIIFGKKIWDSILNFLTI